MSLPVDIKAEIIDRAKELEAEGKYDEAYDLINLINKAENAILYRNSVELRRIAHKLKQFGAFRAARYLERIAIEIEHDIIRGIGPVYI